MEIKSKEIVNPWLDPAHDRKIFGYFNVVSNKDSAVQYCQSIKGHVVAMDPHLLGLKVDRHKRYVSKNRREGTGRS